MGRKVNWPGHPSSQSAEPQQHLPISARLSYWVQRATKPRDIMHQLAGKTAFVTGGASGIGLALGRAFAEAGMKVMLADIEADALEAAVKSFSNGADVRGVLCDVTEPESVERAATAAFEAFGNVHIVCNNAGVGGGSRID